LLSGGWQHIPKEERPEAMSSILDKLRYNGILTIMLRLGEPDPERNMFCVSKKEVELILENT